MRRPIRLTLARPRCAPVLSVRVTLVGIAVANNEVVEDDIDRAYGTIVMTPAYLREAIARSLTDPVLYALQLDHGSRDVPLVEREVTDLIPRGFTHEIHVTSRVVSQVELAVKPESVALGGFGAIAAAVALVLALQAVSRQLHVGDKERGGIAGTRSETIYYCSGRADRHPLRCAIRFASGHWRGVGTVAPVSLRASPPGVPRSRDLLGLGGARRRLGRPGGRSRNRRDRDVLPGGAEPAYQSQREDVVRFACRAGRRSRRDVASACWGSLRSRSGSRREIGPREICIVGHRCRSCPCRRCLHVRQRPQHTRFEPTPVRMELELRTLNPSNDVPPQSLKLLSHDSDVAAWSGFDYNVFDIDGQTVPVLFGRPHAAPSPPVLSGHGLSANDQIVMGAATLAVLRKHVGDTVLLSYGTAADAPAYLPPTRLKIVGTATFPAVGYVSSVADHTSMGTGAWFSEGVFPSTFLKAVNSRDPNLNGPELVFVRLNTGVSAAAGEATCNTSPWRPTRCSRPTPTLRAIASQSSVCSVRHRS